MSCTSAFLYNVLPRQGYLVKEADGPADPALLPLMMNVKMPCCSCEDVQHHLVHGPHLPFLDSAGELHSTAPPMPFPGCPPQHTVQAAFAPKLPFRSGLLFNASQFPETPLKVEPRLRRDCYSLLVSELSDPHICPEYTLQELICCVAIRQLGSEITSHHIDITARNFLTLALVSVTCCWRHRDPLSAVVRGEVGVQMRALVCGGGLLFDRFRLSQALWLCALLIVCFCTSEVSIRP